MIDLSFSLEFNSTDSVPSSLSSRQKKNAKKLESSILKNDLNSVISSSAYTDLSTFLPSSQKYPLVLAIENNRLNATKEILIRLLERNEKNQIKIGLSSLLLSLSSKESISRFSLDILELFHTLSPFIFLEKDINEIPWSFYALNGDKLYLLKKLEKFNVDLNESNESGEPLLHEAIRSNAVNIIQYLSLKEDLLSKKDNSLNTPLHIAVSYGSIPLIQILKECDSEALFVCNKKGLTPLDIAESGSILVKDWRKEILMSFLSTKIISNVDSKNISYSQNRF